MRNKIMEDKILQEIRRLLVHGLATMDESGRRGYGGKTYQLWEAYWDELRLDIFKALQWVDELRAGDEAGGE